MAHMSWPEQTIGTRLVQAAAHKDKPVQFSPFPLSKYTTQKTLLLTESIVYYELAFDIYLH